MDASQRRSKSALTKFHERTGSLPVSSFERLVLAYLKVSTWPLLEPLQFTNRANRSVDDAVNVGLHFILQHLDRPGTYVRILFVDFSSAFNTIIPDTLQNKLTQLSVPTSVCQWITSFLTDRQQVVRLGKFSSSTRTISTGAPQGCVLSPLLFFLYTNDCTSKDPSIKLLKFADDTTLIGLIQDGDWPIYRYIGLPIFFPIFKHFTIIGYRLWKKTITDIFFFVTHNYTEYNQQWNVFSVFDPSKCTDTWSSGHCSLRRSSSTTTACNFIQDSLVWNTLNYINIYYRTIISPINI